MLSVSARDRRIPITCMFRFAYQRSKQVKLPPCVNYVNSHAIVDGQFQFQSAELKGKLGLVPVGELFRSFKLRSLMAVT